MVCPYCGGKLYKNKTVYSKLRQGLITYLQCKECRKTVQEVIPGRDKSQKVDVVLNDIHFNFHDDKVLTKVTSFIIQLKPDRIFLNGDILDCFEISRFDYNPYDPHQLIDELQTCHDWLEHLRINLPDTEIIYIYGNHEQRLARYILRNAPKLMQFPDLSLEKFLKLDELAVTVIDSKLSESYFNTGHGLLIGHFDIVRKNSAYTVRALLERHATSVIQAHVHRIGVHSRTLHDKTVFGYENGCLCLLNPPYMLNPDWQQGFSIINWNEDEWHVTQVPIINGNFHYNGWN